jgi:hypothetical protein
MCSTRLHSSQRIASSNKKTRIEIRMNEAISTHLRQASHRPGSIPVHPIYRDKGQLDALPGEQDEQSSNASLKKWFQVWLDPARDH